MDDQNHEARLLTAEEVYTLPAFSVLWEEQRDEQYPDEDIKPYPVELECVVARKLLTGDSAECCILTAMT